MNATTDLIIIGRIERPFGVHGDVRVQSLSDAPGRFEHLTSVTLVAADGRTIRARVTRVRKAGHAYIIGFDTFSSPEEAVGFKGGVLQVPRASSPPLPDDHYYVGDLIDLSVRDDRGRPLGRLEEVWELPGSHVLVVRDGRRERLIPATKRAVAAVDLSGRSMTIRAAYGLVEGEYEV
jgi:16S rRNA processing protein RimM